MVGAAPRGASVKVLTVREPWLWSIVAGCKTVENRGPGMFAPTSRLIGQRVGLHGSVSWSKRGQHDERVRACYGGDVPAPERVGRYLVHHRCDGFGLIIATVQIDDVHPDANCCRPWGESQYLHVDGTMQQGVTHIVLSDVDVLDCVIPARGRLGWWESAELDEELAS